MQRSALLAINNTSQFLSSITQNCPNSGTIPTFTHRSKMQSIAFVIGPFKLEE
jgi:hypothetical protein